MMSLEELEQYFLKHNFPVYSRENYDRFIKDNKFDFSLPSIHITGTNGKGSTANFLYHIYVAKGYKVGLYVSPYLTSVLEMVSINGNQISAEEYIKVFESLKDQFEKHHLSSFEMQTIIAFTLFNKAGLDLVVVEVGMGGYVDATNIFNPILSIITSVSLEHTAYLGRSISEIASNKAGIIKYKTPVLVGKLEETAMYAIREKTKKTESNIYIVDEFHNEKIDGNSWVFDYKPYHNLVIKTEAKYQCTNASLAIEATNILNNEFPVDEESVLKGLQASTLPCRFEYLSDNILIDGSHNAEGTENLATSLEAFENRPIHIVFACFRDKNLDSMLINLSKVSSDITITTFNHPRARTEEEYFLYLGDYKFTDDYIGKIHELKSEFPDDLILVTGSLCFAGIVREILKNEK